MGYLSIPVEVPHPQNAVDHKLSPFFWNFPHISQTYIFQLLGNTVICMCPFSASFLGCLALSHPLPLHGWWPDYPVAMCVSRRVRSQCVCKGLVSFSINIMTGLATFPHCTNNLRGGESGWSISSLCLPKSRPTLIP